MWLRSRYSTTFIRLSRSATDAPRGAEILTWEEVPSGHINPEDLRLRMFRKADDKKTVNVNTGAATYDLPPILNNFARGQVTVLPPLGF